MASPTFRAINVTSYTSGTSAIVTKPSGTTTDDVLLAILYLEATTVRTITWPGSFTPIGSTQNNNDSGKEVGLYLAYKVATGGEGADYTASWDGGAFYNKFHMAAIIGALTSSPIDDFAFSNLTGAAGSVTSPSVTAAAADTYLACLPATWDGGSGYTSATLTIRLNNGTVGYGDKAISATGATGTNDVSLNGTKGGRIGASVLIASTSGGGTTPITVNNLPIDSLAGGEIG